MSVKHPAVEAAVLAACVLPGQDGAGRWDSIREQTGGRPEELFNDPDLNAAARAVASLSKRGHAITDAAVSDFIRANGSEEDGDEWAERVVARLRSGSVTVSDTDFQRSMDILLEARAGRRIVSSIEEVTEEIRTGKMDSAEAAVELGQIASLGGYGQDRTHRASDVFSDIMESINRGQAWRVSTGITELDPVVQWEPGQYSLLAGLNHVSAVHLMIHAAVNALDSGATVVLCSQDMSRRKLYTGLLASTAVVGRDALYDVLVGAEVDLSEDQVSRVQRAQAWLSQADLHILFAEDLPEGVSSLAPKLAGIRNSIAEDRPLVVFYDNLQLDFTKTASERPRDNMFTRTAISSRTAKGLSVAFDAAVVMLSHARTGEFDGRPVFKGMEGASSIETDADNVILVSPRDPDERLTEAYIEVRTPYDSPQTIKVMLDGSNSTVRYIEGGMDDDETDVDFRGSRGAESGGGDQGDGEMIVSESAGRRGGRVRPSDDLDDL